MECTPLDLRYYLLSVHYRTNLKFTKKGLEDAHKARRKIMEWMKEVEGAKGIEGIKGIEEWGEKFADAMNADLNTPAALAVVFDLMTWSRNEGKLGECSGVVKMIQDTFGCFESQDTEVSQEVLDLAQKREDARANGDYGASDTLRDEILALGYEVKDTPEGQKLSKL
jgi:cysteinyl-tRNA synthetase